MNKQRQTSFTKTIIGSTQRLFRSNNNRSLTMRDIGFNPVGQF